MSQTVLPTKCGRKESKGWCITINNPDSDCLTFDESKMEYMICAVEVGKEGTKHIQGYVYFLAKKRFTYVKKLWPTAHIEAANGKPVQNQAYCSKDGCFHEHGKLPAGAGARTDLEHVRDLIDSGATIESIRSEHYGSYIKYNGALRRDFEDRQPVRTWKTELHILWGPTGAGKSYFCAQGYPQAYWKSSGPWWDGYESHETVVLDEFVGWLPIHEMLRLADRYPLRVPVKGGFRNFVAKRIFVCSNDSWDEWWRAFVHPETKRDREQKKAFERRITSVRYLPSRESVEEK